MKLFVYKSAFIFLLLFVAYKLTVGSLIGQIERKINEIVQNNNIEQHKSNIRSEIKSVLKKDRVINKEDARLIKQLIDKIKKEIDGF
jgi:Asp/Glu/hydantoin racemase